MNMRSGQDVVTRSAERRREQLVVDGVMGDVGTTNFDSALLRTTRKAATSVSTDRSACRAHWKHFQDDLTACMRVDLEPGGGAACGQGHRMFIVAAFLQGTGLSGRCAIGRNSSAPSAGSRADITIIAMTARARLEWMIDEFQQARRRGL